MARFALRPCSNISVKASHKAFTCASSNASLPIRPVKAETVHTSLHTIIHIHFICTWHQSPSNSFVHAKYLLLLECPFVISILCGDVDHTRRWLNPRIMYPFFLVLMINNHNLSDRFSPCQITIIQYIPPLLIWYVLLYSIILITISLNDGEIYLQIYSCLQAQCIPYSITALLHCCT